MRLILSLALLLVTTPAFAAADHYEFDKEHTNILFFVNHVGFSEMVGRFTRFDGNFTFDQEKPEQSAVEVSIDPAGVRTSSEGLDAHLQKEEFFNTKNFPKITFKSRSITATGKNTGDIAGDITLLGVTKPAVLHVTFNKGDYFPMTQQYKAGFTAETTVKRSDFGMKTGIPMVGDDVRIQIFTEAVNLDRKKALERKQD